MLTNSLYRSFAQALVDRQGVFEALYVAVGSGHSQWDTQPPPYQRDVAALKEEVFRKAVASEDVIFVDEQGAPSNTTTARVSVRARFLPYEGEGILRECGLFAGDASQAADSGELLSYFMHPGINKDLDMTLERRITLDFVPHAAGPGQGVTRYLGNSNSRELHDLERETQGCQIAEMRFDRRIYFASPEQAIALGYDYCAYCFGRELSQR